MIHPAIEFQKLLLQRFEEPTKINSNNPIEAKEDLQNQSLQSLSEAIDFPMSISPNELKIELHEKIYRLIQYKFAEYLNLLYIIDVSEDQIKKLDGSDLVILSEEVAFLILKREWQKVWFRNKY